MSNNKERQKKIGLSGQLNALEGSVKDIRDAAMHAASRLTSLSARQERLSEASDIVSCFTLFINDDTEHLKDLEVRDPKRMARRLCQLRQIMINGIVDERTILLFEQYSEAFERAFLAKFTTAMQARHTDEMWYNASILNEFNESVSCIKAFIGNHPVFQKTFELGFLADQAMEQSSQQSKEKVSGQSGDDGNQR